MTHLRVDVQKSRHIGSGLSRRVEQHSIPTAKDDTAMHAGMMSSSANPKRRRRKPGRIDVRRGKSPFHSLDYSSLALAPLLCSNCNTRVYVCVHIESGYYIYLLFFSFEMFYWIPQATVIPIYYLRNPLLFLYRKIDFKLLVSCSSRKKNGMFHFSSYSLNKNHSLTRFFLLPGTEHHSCFNLLVSRSHHNYIMRIILIVKTGCV